MSDKKTEKPITVRMPIESYKALVRLAEVHRRPVSYQALHMIEEYLRQNDYLEKHFCSGVVEPTLQERDA